MANRNAVTLEEAIAQLERWNAVNVVIDGQHWDIRTDVVHLSGGEEQLAVTLDNLKMLLRMDPPKSSDAEGQSTGPVDLTIRMGTAPKIVVWDGVEACYFDDAYQGGESHLRPLQKAVLITRLRVLADILESTP